MKFIVSPLKGVNDIEFGMTAEMVRERMIGIPEIADIRAASIEHPTHFYPDIPVFFYFDESGFLDGIEFCRGADVTIGAVNPFHLSVREAIRFCNNLDPETIVDDDGALSLRLSLAFWCPNIGDEEDEEPVETFLTGRPGYYDTFYASKADQGIDQAGTIPSN